MLLLPRLRPHAPFPSLLLFLVTPNHFGSTPPIRSLITKTGICLETKHSRSFRFWAIPQNSVPPLAPDTPRMATKPGFVVSYPTSNACKLALLHLLPFVTWTLMGRSLFDHVKNSKILSPRGVLTEPGTPAKRARPAGQKRNRSNKFTHRTLKWHVDQTHVVPALRLMGVSLGVSVSRTQQWGNRNSGEPTAGPTYGTPRK